MKTLIFDLDGTLVRLKPRRVCLVKKDELAALRATYNFALVSGSTRKEVFQSLAKTGLWRFFDKASIVTLEDTNSKKVSGKPFREIKKRLTGTMVMIGDSDSDRKGAKIARLPFVRVRSYTDLTKQRAALTTAIRKARETLDEA